VLNSEGAEISIECTLTRCCASLTVTTTLAQAVLAERRPVTPSIAA
jgi:hypothetical protein